MRITEYDPEKHYNTLIKLSNENGIPVLDPIFIPKIGYVIDDVAICFMYQTDSSICIFENLIISPRVRKAERTEAFDLMTETLLKRAKDEGNLAVYGISDNAHVPNRLKKHSFENRKVNYFFRRT